MSYCNIDDIFGDVYVNGDFLVRMENPPIDISVSELKKIIIGWDNNQNYLIQNQNNYSYSVYQVAQTCRIFFTHPIDNLKYYITFISNNVWQFNRINTSYIFTFDSSGNPQRLNRYVGFENPPPTNRNYKFLVGRLDSTYQDTGYIQNVSTVSNVTVIDRVLDSRYIPVIIQKELINPTWELMINDGGAVSKRGIINPNSVNVINQNNGYKLTITDQSYTVTQNYLDQPFYDVICGEDCPPGTLKCDDGTGFCCYDCITGKLIKRFDKI